MSQHRLAWLWRCRADYRKVFETPEGRRVLGDLFAFCNIARPVAVGGDPYATYHNDGMRRVALRISSILRMTDDQVQALAGEATQEQQDVSED